MACPSSVKNCPGRNKNTNKQTTVVKQPSVKIYSLADLRKMQIKKS